MIPLLKGCVKGYSGRESGETKGKGGAFMRGKREKKGKKRGAPLRPEELVGGKLLQQLVDQAHGEEVRRYFGGFF